MSVGIELEKIKEDAKQNNAEIILSKNDIIDENHLMPIWYGGEIGRIKYSDGYSITIGAYGDICIYGKINGEEICLKDKSCSGSMYSELGISYNIDDKKLVDLLNSTDPENYLEYMDSNWFECNVITPAGEWYDLCFADNVLDDNLLDCFKNIGDYLEYTQIAKNIFG